MSAARSRSAPASRAPLIAGIAILAWTVFFLWANADSAQPSAGPEHWTALVAQWSMPVLLTIALWLLAARNSAASPSHAASEQADLAAIERRLAALDETLGRGTPSAGGSAPPLALLQDNDADFDRLVERRMEHLRLQAERFKVELESRESDNLSAIRRRAEELSKALSAQDIAMRRSAGQALDELQARFRTVRDESLRLTGELERVQADALRGWDGAVAALETRMQATLGKVVEVDEGALENARTRLAALHAEAERIDTAAAERLQAFETELARRRDASLAGGDEALAALDRQLAEFDRRLDERREIQLARLAELGERSEDLAARLADVDTQLAGHVGQVEAASNALGSFADDLSGRLTQSRDLLETSGKSLAGMTEAGTRLFELVRASADYSAQTIPVALASAQDQLGAFETRTNALRDAIAAAEEKGAALVTHLDRAREGVPVSAETLDALGKRLEELAAQSDALARRTREDLSGAIAELENSSQGLADRLRAGQEAALSEFAATFGERSLEVVGRGLREKTQAAIAELDSAARAAGRAGLETVGQLRDQMVEVQEMAGNLEARVAEARTRAQDEPTKDFSIEMTKIIEKLNGAALDITKVFDADVPDVAWQAYLRGDYGVFTRKAVRLLSSQRSEAVFGLYQHDEGFRDLVNRYVRDFESMLRVVLATRNAHALAVTLLSSDVGKLYVALAQATERLRD